MCIVISAEREVGLLCYKVESPADMPIQLQTFVIQWRRKETLYDAVVTFLNSKDEIVLENRQKVRFTPYQATNQIYSSTLSLTSALDGNGWSTPGPGHFTPGELTRYQPYRRLGQPQGWSGWLQKIWPPTVFDSSPERVAVQTASENIYLKEISGKYAKQIKANNAYL